MDIHVVTLFPDFFRAPLGLSIPGRAAESGLARYALLDLRAFTHDRHHTVDDYPYGGGGGMVMKAEPFLEAVGSIAPKGPVLLMSARGRPFRHEDAVRLSLEEELVFLCGHYKDVDQRVAEVLGAEELSLGDFVLSGGEFAALAMIDAVVRLLPGAVGAHESAAGDSFYEEGLLSAPSYTRPPEVAGRTVPEVLLSGDHARVEAWRRAEAERLTRERRPDLWRRWQERHEDGTDGAA